jgi:hypothetical protein
MRHLEVGQPSRRDRRPSRRLLKVARRGSSHAPRAARIAVGKPMEPSARPRSVRNMGAARRWRKPKAHGNPLVGRARGAERADRMRRGVRRTRARRRTLRARPRNPFPDQARPSSRADALTRMDLLARVVQPPRGGREKDRARAISLAPSVRVSRRRPRRHGGSPRCRRQCGAALRDRFRPRPPPRSSSASDRGTEGNYCASATAWTSRWVPRGS